MVIADNKKTRDKTIAIIVCDYPLGTAQLVTNCIKMFCENGFTVDIFADSGSLGTPLRLPETAHIKQLKEGVWGEIFRRFLAWGWFRRMWPDKRVSKLAALVPSWASFAKSLRRAVLPDAYKAVFCISYPALFAFAVHPFSGNVVYFNLELLDDQDDGAALYINKKLCKTLEKAALQHVTRVISMSEERAKIFCEASGYRGDLAVLPILPRSSDAPAQGSYFRDRFNIPAEKKIVLYCGGIGAWALLHEIIETVSHWPNDMIFIIHTWDAKNLENEYGQKLYKAARELPVYFSTEALTREELSSAMTSANFGIAYYDTIDSNFKNILFSSNKISEYLLAGLPVICSPFPELKEFIDNNNLGEAIPVCDIPEALKKISHNREQIAQSIDVAVKNFFKFDTFFYKAFSDFVKED